MTTHIGAPAPGLAPDDAGPVWHTLSADGVLRAEKVDEQSGLSSAEAAARAEQFGPNKFDAGKSEPRWRAFLRQYTDLMQIVLLAAGVVTFSLYALFFSIETRDERRTAFSLDTFSDAKFVIATGVSILTLLLTTVFGPLQTFLKTTSLDVRQWSICLAVALSIVVVSEIYKAVRRHTAAGQQETR
ncbi:MAG TPA: cation-transporting P-type ATPase [Streptosporangiaceae bacterium]|nr:cation-transporting P-type ATPase [Streptosporangiaceae bacterium]